MSHNHDLQETEHHVEHQLQQHPHDFKSVFKELDHLRKHEPNQFHQDLKEINDHLHQKGLLPHMQIVEEGDNFAVTSDSPNPKHQAVVSKSYEPKQSAAEEQTYKNMGYSGWKDSATGGGGANGGFDNHAIAGEVPQGQQKTLIQEALKLAGLPDTPENEAAINLIVQKESGWNPNAINLTDSNATAGHPSQGLMQTIPSTFKAYALPGYDSNINDPLSNLVAGIRYAEATYGGVQNVPGVVAVAQGKNYVGY